MKREAKLLRLKAISSLTLSIDHFNRPTDSGRAEAVLIFLDHSFELLLKAALLHRGGRIWKPKQKQTIGFDECVQKAVHGGKVQFLTIEQGLLLQAINGLRDAAQHHLLDITEQHLYLQAQAGVMLFKAILQSVFGLDLSSLLPTRVLPLSTMPPMDLLTLFEHETKEIEQLLRPGKRRHTEAFARLRGLAIVEGAIQGDRFQPSEDNLAKLSDNLRAGVPWDQIFPGVASLNMTAMGYGPSIDLRITKNEGLPVQLVPEGTPGASIVAVKRVDVLGFYNLGRDQLAEKVGLSGPKTTAMIRYLDLQSDADSYKEIMIGKTKFGRYSQKAISKICDALKTCHIERIWAEYGVKPKKSA